MKPLALTAALMLALSTTGLARDAQPDPRLKANGRATYIVSFAEQPLASYTASPAITAKSGKRLEATATAVTGARRLDTKARASVAYLEHLDARKNEWLTTAANALGHSLDVRARYGVVANGMAVALTPAEAEIVGQLPGVTAVAPDRVFRPLTDAGPRWIGADQAWAGTIAGSTVRTRGEGVVVGVLDGGVNWGHPSFADVAGDGFNHSNPRGRVYGLCETAPTRCNDKLIGIWDMTDEGTRDGSDTDGHGTHVASTAVGNVVNGNVTAGGVSVPLTISGVAPRANLITYKVCRRPADNPEGTATCSAADMIEGIEQAVRDNVDVLNASLGGDPYDPWQSVRANSVDPHVAWLNARAAGLVTVLAAGNDGPRPGTVGSVANAPWVIATANATHDRLFGTTLAQVTGTGIAQPQSFAGGGSTGGLSSRRIVDARDFGNALCGTGTSQGTEPTGASNPFPAGTFNGEIVICTRGIYARVEKSFNVRAGGAGGMILVNTPAEAESIVSDAHVIPTVHLGYVAGQRLVTLVANARAAGGAIQGEIIGTTRVVDASRADVLSASSGRGPVSPAGGWLKPNIAGPGTDILAAGQTGNTLAFLSGTSMASPHVAGAAALIAAAFPTWSNAQIESALLTTGTSTVRTEDGQTPANPHQTGGGRVSVPDALRASLYFNVTRAEFVGADPQRGGNPRALNMPYLVDHACLERCSWQRTVTASVAGTWRFEWRGAVAPYATVTPSQFTLAAGQSQNFTVNVDLTTAPFAGTWVYGELAMIPATGVEQRLPVAVFDDPGAIPSNIEITAQSTGGSQIIDVTDVVSLPDAIFTAGPLVRGESFNGVVPRDPSGERNTPYTNPSNGGVVRTVQVIGTGTRRQFAIVARTSSSEATDVDLFVGLDADGDGAPDSNEELCSSSGASTNETCTVDATLAEGQSQTYWIYAQNFASPAAQAAIDLQYGAVPKHASGDPQVNPLAPSLSASGVGRNAARAPFKLRVAWYQPDMLPNEVWYGFVGVGASRNRPDQLGQSLVTLRASNAMTLAPIALDARDDSVHLRLNPGVAHDRIVVDVPANATAMTASTNGSGNVDLYVARASAETSGPGFDAAPPRGQAQGTSIHAGSTETVDLNGAALTPGRWYLTPVNAGTSVADITLSVRTTIAGNAPALRDNGYFNPARSGHGLFFSDVGTQWATIWYTYLEDGTSTWYIAQAPSPTATESVWRSPLYRFTWNGAQNLGTVVGQALITRTATDQFHWTWLLDGQWGSEPMVPVAPIACTNVGGTPTNFTGGWYAPVLPGYGFSVLTVGESETEVVYLYDAQGVARWAYAQGQAASTGLALSQFNGFCPQCARVEPQATAVGALTRAFATPRAGTANVQVNFVTPLVGAWSTNQATEKLTRDLSCQ